MNKLFFKSGFAVRRQAILFLCFLPFLMAGCQQVGRGRRVEKMQHRLESGAAAERIEVLKRIRRNPPANLRPALEYILAEDSRHHVARSLAAEALGNLGDPNSTERLRRALERDIDRLVRKKALIALVDIHGEAAEEDLSYAVKKDPAPLVRITALDLAVLNLEQRESLGLLKEAVDDQAEVVRLAAYDHLRDLTDLDLPPDARTRWREELGILMEGL